MNEFLRREGIAEPRALLERDLPPHEPAQRAHRTSQSGSRAIIAGGVLLAVTLAGVVAYRHVVSVPRARQSAPQTFVPISQAPIPNPDSQSQSVASNSTAAVPVFPREPVPPPPPAALNNWAFAPVLPKSPIEPRVPVQHKPPAATAQAVVSASLPSPPRALPQASHAGHDGGAVHLRIVYTPSGPADRSRVDTLISHLRSQFGNIDTATVAPGPPTSELVVVYFFASDHALARRLGSSLGLAARRRYRLALGHEQPSPDPGTLEIQLPP